MSEQEEPLVRMPIRLPQHARQHFNRIERQKRMLMTGMARWLHQIHGDPIRGDDAPERKEDPAKVGAPLEKPRFEDPTSRAMPRTYLDGISSVDYKVVGQLAQTDIAASRWEVIAMHTGELLGVPATGREVEITGMTIVKMKDNQAVEEWTYWDLPGLMSQIGATP